MVWLSVKKIHMSALILLTLTALIYFNEHLHTSLVAGEDGSENPRVAIFYGSPSDKQLSEQMVESVEIRAEFYNITRVLKNNSFFLDNQTINTIW